MRFSALRSLLIPAAAWVVAPLVSLPLFAAPAADAPGPRLRTDATRLVAAMERAAAPGCSESQPFAIGTSAPTTASPFWLERWQVDRCGKTVTWDVRYTPSPRGATDVTVSVEGDDAAPPAATNARPQTPAGRRVFVVSSASTSGPGTLAQAILDANAAPNDGGPDVIRFDIPGSGPRVIALDATLPAITDPVVIDGFSQPGASARSIEEKTEGDVMVELDGSRLDRGTHGVTIRSSSSVIRGLRIHGFDGDAVRIEGGRDNRIEGNVIEGNALAGVRVAGDGADGNTIVGNRIFANVEAGIRLGDAAGAEDAPASVQPNDGRRPPLLTSASFDRGRDGDAPDAIIEGVFDGAPFTSHRIELFANGPADSPAPEGARFLAATDVITGADGRAAFQFHMPVGVHGHELLTATATDAQGNTSPFSDPLLSPNMVISWNTGTGMWGTATNWSPQQLPASGDDVVIAANGTNTTFTVTLNVVATINSFSVGGGSGAQTLSLANNLTFAAASSVSSTSTLSFSAGVLSATADLTIDGAFNWSGGTMSGAGTTTVNGAFGLSGLTALKTSRVLTTTAATTWTSASGLGVQTGTGSVINNSGTWDIQTDGAAIVNAFGGTMTFNNSGTFKKTTTTGSTSVNVPFANTGTVDVQSGTISLGNGGSSSTALNVSAAGGVLLFAAGTFDLNAGTTLSGPGTVRINTSGTVNVNAAISVPAATTLAFVAGTLGGTGTLTVAGTLNWSGGTMTGAGITTVNGPLNLSGLTAIKASRTLNTTAATTWTSASGLGMQTGTGSIINNSGTWETQTDGAAIVNSFGGTSTINNSGTFKKTTTTGATSLNVPVVNTGTIDVQTGTINLGGGGSNTTNLTISGAAGVLQFTAGTFDLNTGTAISGAGTFRINTTGTVNVNAAMSIPAATSLDFLAGTLGGTGTFTVNGPFSWSGGTMSGAGTTTVNGTLSLSGVTAVRINRTLNTTATTNWTSASGLGVQTGTGSIINNSGTWNAQTDGAAIVNSFGGTSTFNNSGTFKKSAVTGTTTVSIPFANTGTVDVQSGTVSLSGGGSNTNALTISGAAATLQLAAGTFDLNAGTAISGPGIFLLNSSGTVNFNVPVSIPAATAFNFVAGTLAGTGAVTINGPFNWSGGSMTGAAATTVNGTFNLSGLTAISGSRTLNNATTANWTSGANDGMWTGTGSIINNTGTWDAQVDGGAIVNHYGGATTFNNSGTYKKSAGSGTTFMDIGITNTGTVNAQAGTIALRAGLTNSATLNASGAGTKIQLTAGVDDLNAGTVITGPGTIEFNSSGTMNVNAPLAVPAATTFSFFAGTLQGAAPLTLNGTFNWTGGSMTGAATTTANGPLNLGGLVRIFNSRTLNTNALTTWTSASGLGVQTGTGSIINNTGTWDIQTDGNALVNSFGGASTFNNSGTFQKSASTGSTSVSIPFFNTGTVDIQSGTINFSSSNYSQTAGTTRVGGAGILTSTTTVAISGGILAGTGTVSGPVIVSGSGAVAPGSSPGTLTIAGNYTQQAPGAAFNVELGGTTAGTQYDQLNVTGVSSSATLAGVLNVTLVNGFTPSAGDSFTIMSYPSETGTYTLNLPTLTCLGWVVNYGPTSLVLNVVPVPAEVQGFGFGANNTTLQWSSGPIGAAATYDLLRGGLNTLPVGPGAGETCFAQGISTTSTTDATVPAPGTGFWYVVRERRGACGVGTYGYATGGVERVSSGCP